MFSRKKDSAKKELPAIAIVGNMNVGKTTLFSRICRVKTKSINYPGSTVQISVGKILGLEKNAIDTPGTSSIFTHNEDERVSRDILLSFEDINQTEGIIQVADAKNLKRSIALALQYAEYGIPMLLDINMIDEAASRGIEINKGALSKILGIDVFTTVATENIGIGEIKAKITSMKIPNKLVHYPQWVEEFIDIFQKLFSNTKQTPTRGLALLLLAGDKSVENFMRKKFGAGTLNQFVKLAKEYRSNEKTEFTTLLTNLYNKMADKIIRQVQRTAPPPKSKFIERLGGWCTQLSTGIPIAILILFLMYEFVGAFGATFLVDLINKSLFENILTPVITKIIAPIPSVFFKDMIIHPDFGIVPTGIYLAIGLVLPVLFCFYLFFGFLEDSGYLPRISVLLDRAFHLIGLNGKGVMPMVMGFSCTTMAILTTRMLDTKKEKNIATFLLIFGIPCAPLLSVMLVLLQKMPVSATLAVFGVLILQMMLAGFLLNKLSPGKHSPILIEIPPMRIPDPKKILIRSSLRTYSFMKEAIPLFILASLVVFFFDRIGGLTILERIMHPVTTVFMGLPDISVQVFIKALIRKSNGAAELRRLGDSYNNLQLVVNILVMTFLVPCLNAIMVLVKERGAKTAVFMITGIMMYAFIVGGIVNHACHALGITFQ